MFSRVARFTFALSLAVALSLRGQAPAGSPLTIQFKSHDGHELAGKLVTPVGVAPRAIVVYVQAAEAMTIDMKRSDGRGGTFNYFDVYRALLPPTGIGFMSYEGRGVRMGDSPPRFESIDTAIYNTSTLSNKALDLLSAIRAVRRQPGLATVPVIVIGASEGTLIAADAVARAPSEIQAMVLYGVLSENMRENFRFIMTGGAFTTYRTKFDANGDGRISLAEFEADPAHYRARVWQNAPFAVFDHNGDGFFTVDEVQYLTRVYLDAIDHESFATLDQWARVAAGVSLPADWFRDHFAHDDMWTFLSQVDMPIGFFQGELDEMASPEALHRLESKARVAGKTRFEFHYFKGLGHSLDVDQYFLTHTLPKGHQDIFAFIDRVAPRAR